MVSTRYCPDCGERSLHPAALTVRGLFHQLVGAFSGLDGRLVASFRCLLNHPGALTQAFVQGRRKPFIGPFQLFLLANLVFFTVQSITGNRIFSSTIDSHLHNQDWSPVAQILLNHHLKSAAMSLTEFAPLFDQAVVVNAKSLVILMTVPFALLLPLLFFRSHRPFTVHAVFSLHFYAFLLLLFCVVLAIAALDAALGGAGIQSPFMDITLTAVIFVSSLTYLLLAISLVYQEHGVARFVKAFLLALAAGAIALAYRFLIFLITLYGLL